MPPKKILHPISRSETHPEYPQRAEVSDSYTSWARAWEAYAAPDFTAESVLNAEGKNANGLVDGPEPDQAVISQRTSYAVHFKEKLKFGEDGRPMNPVGRTGLRGRGVLGLWGPNHIARPIITRDGPDGLEAYLSRGIEDSAMWSIPEEFVEAGQMITEDTKLELVQSTMAQHSPAEVDALTALLDRAFEDSMVIKKGYIDDPRNTDNAWMEGITAQFHLPPQLAAQVRLQSLNDTIIRQFVRIEETNMTAARISAAARPLLEATLTAHRAEFPKKLAPKAAKAAKAAKSKSPTDLPPPSSLSPPLSTRSTASSSTLKSLVNTFQHTKPTPPFLHSLRQPSTATLNPVEADIRLTDFYRDVTNSHVLYRITSNIMHSGNTVKCDVFRRYKDFVALVEEIREDFPSVPLLPPKPLNSSLKRFDPDFVRTRSKELDAWVRAVYRLKGIRENDPATNFLSAQVNRPTIVRQFDTQEGLKLVWEDMAVSDFAHFVQTPRLRAQSARR